MSKNKKSSNWKKLNEIFADAVRLTSAEQKAFVANACSGDENLQREVESILAASSRADAQDFLKADAFAAGARILVENSESAHAGKQIGKYKIIREIGRGGMGAIYLAEREDFHQRVALKIIKRGMDTDEIIRRFRREREVLATLNHPNIARLFDGGTTDDGLPYLVMEYIEGEPVTEFCDRKKIGIEERLALFRKICEAVSFAHQNLIVHRDLKPSNILVDKNGETKLLDFGIAKLLAQTDETQTLTEAGMRLMTPEYASPEQIRGEPVTILSDIYGLGVLLYELLSGHRPFILKNRPMPEIVRIISEQEPPAPSTAAVTTEKTDQKLSPETVADLRGERPQTLRRRLSGDLDNITLKALRKEPDERYESAGEFSEDVRRHLGGLPVAARPANASYRAMKFVRRNRTAFAMATLLVLLIAATGASWIYFLRFSSFKNNAARIVSDRSETRTIAVLPFTEGFSDLGSDKAAAELTATFAGHFGKAGKMQVISPDALTTERAMPENCLLVGQKLGADAVLTGGFFELDEKRIYIRFHLINVGDGEVLWARTYNEPRENLPVLLDEIEYKIERILQQLAAPEEYRKRARRFTASDEAYQLYLQGRLLWKMRGDTIENTPTSLSCFERAIKLDPNFALPYVGLADIYKTNDYNDPRRRLSEEMVRKALELAPDSADAHATLGFIRMFHYWDWTGAENEFQQAFALDAECLGARQWYALMLALQERNDEALQQIERARHIADSINIRIDFAELAYLTRDYRASLDIFKVLSEDLGNKDYNAIADINWHAGNYEEAVRLYINAGWISDANNKDEMIAAFRRGDKKPLARHMIASSNKTDSAALYKSYNWLPYWYGVLDERGRALDLLEQAAGEHRFFIIYIKANPFLKDLRSEPRFQALLKRVGLLTEPARGG